MVKDIKFTPFLWCIDGKRDKKDKIKSGKVIDDLKGIKEINRTEN